jgi:hypothetical protein
VLGVIIESSLEFERQPILQEPTRQASADPTKWVEDWQPSRFPDVDGRLVKVAILRADTVFWRGGSDALSSAIETMRLAYKGVAQVLFDAGALTQRVLEIDLPIFMWDCAVAGGWWHLASEQPTEIFSEPIGHYWFQKDHGNSWRNLFRANTSEWQARLLEQSTQLKPDADARLSGVKQFVVAGKGVGSSFDDGPPEEPLLTTAIHAEGFSETSEARKATTDRRKSKSTTPNSSRKELQRGGMADEGSENRRRITPVDKRKLPAAENEPPSESIPVNGKMIVAYLLARSSWGYPLPPELEDVYLDTYARTQLPHGSRQELERLKAEWRAQVRIEQLNQRAPAIPDSRVHMQAQLLSDLVEGPRAVDLAADPKPEVAADTAQPTIKEPAGKVGRPIKQQTGGGAGQGIDGKSQSQPHRKEPRELQEPGASKPLGPSPPAIKLGAAQNRLGKRLKKLKTESKLTWTIIAKESGVSYRWLLDIARGRTPSAETRKAIRDYFSRVLKRAIRF